MTSSSSVVHVQDLRKCYRRGMFGRRVDALQGVSLEVPRGKVFGLLGPNGAGKTTMIKILLGIIRASGGKASLLGWPAGDRRGRRRVGYLPENLQVPAHQTATTALEYFGRLSGMSHQAIRTRRDELLSLVGLKGREKESVTKFSKGMRQRLGLAQALLHDPELLILDEPTDGLDPIGRSDVRTILRQLSDEGRTVFVNSHLLQEVELVCDHVAILNHGTLRYVGSLDDFTGSDDANLDLILVAQEARVRSLLAERSIQSIATQPDGRLRLSINVDGQEEVNQIVDQLRQGNVDILSLNRRKQTLESFFLDIVNRASTPT